MSGGSYDYAYSRIEDLAVEIEGRSKFNGLRLAFAKHLHLVAKAAHDIEWVDSGDCGPGDENKAIEAVLKSVKHNPEIEAKAAAYDELAKWFKEDAVRAEE